MDKANSVSESVESYFDAGTEITAYAFPNEGCRFKEWQDVDGNVVSTENPYTFTLNSDTTLYAIWEDIPATEYAITVTDGKATFTVDVKAWEKSTAVLKSSASYFQNLSL